MARVDDINDRMDDMGIEDEENTKLDFDEEAEDISNKFETCIVGSKIGNGEDPLEVPLVNLQFWIQLVGVPSGLMTEAAGKQLVTHTERSRAKKMQLSIREGGREWGAWLRALARMAAGQERRRFLRDDRDGDWDELKEIQTSFSNFRGDFGSQLVPTNLHGRVVSYALSNKAGNQGFIFNNRNEFLGAKFKNPIGPIEEELTGLNVKEGNKRRRGPNDRVGMEIEGDTRVLFSEAGLSRLDFSTSSASDLAKFAVQDSHP
ncbi:hypothetical protein AgCh_036634 [Apium graveolens]